MKILCNNSIAIITALFITSLPASYAQNSKADLHLEVSTAWDGHSRHGSTTEIGISLLSQQGGAIEIEILNGLTPTIIKVTLEAGIVHNLWLPARNLKLKQLEITAKSQTHQSATTNTDLQLHSRDRPILAVLSAGNTESENNLLASNKIEVLRPAISSLPRHAQAYETIDALIIDAENISGLQRQQLFALKKYLQACGRVVVVGLNKQAASILSDNAGCNGQFFVVAENYSQAIIRAMNTLELTPSPLPNANQLAHFFHDNRQPLFYTLGALILTYFILLLFFSRLRQHPILIVSIPIFTTLIIIVVSTNTASNTKALYWTENYNGDHHARFSMLLRSSGSGPQLTRISFPLSLGLPRNVQISTREQKTIINGNSLGDDKTNNKIAKLEFNSHLFSQDDFYWQGSVEFQAPLSLSFLGGKPTVGNPNFETSPPGYLHWKSAYYAVPKLAPGIQWSPQNKNRLSFPEKIPSFYEALLPKNEITLLIPYTLNKLQQLNTYENGWLLIRERPVS